MRSPRLLPARWEPLLASRDFNALAHRSLPVKLAAAISLLLYALCAFRLALRADGLCSHWLVPCGLIGALLSRLLRIPHVAVEHSGALHLLTRIPFGARIAHFIACSSDRMILVSLDLKKKLVALCPEAVDRAGVLAMGVHCDSAESIGRISDAGGVLTILFVGRLIEIKGVDVLLRAVAGVDEWETIIAGAGNKQAELERLADEVRARVRFCGQVDRERRNALFAAADVVVIPSLELPGGRTEGTPVVCLEAMAAGRAVIASRTGGLAKIIRDGENGFLFEPGDHRQLRELLERIGIDPEMRHRLGEGGRRTAAQFDWSRVGPEFGSIIKTAIRGNEQHVCARRLYVRKPAR
jgi:glycosyltransferase involved in cell wall biosynthesis